MPHSHGLAEGQSAVHNALLRITVLRHGTALHKLAHVIMFNVLCIVAFYALLLLPNMECFPSSAHPCEQATSGRH